MRSWAALDSLAQIEHIHLAVADEIGPIYNASGKRGLRLAHVRQRMDEIISMQSVVKVTKQGLCRSIDREMAILNLQNSTYYGLNPVGAFIWSLMQRPTSVRELRDAMLKKYEVDEQRCERELLDLLQAMCSEGLVQVQSAGFH
jgi:hypothetical protein